MTSQLSLKGIAPSQKSGSRFDQVAADLFPDYSRSLIQSWIKSGELTLDGRVVKPNTKLVGGEELILQAETQEEGDWEAQDIPLEVVYEDQSIVVINKSPDFVVHPAAGNWDGTVLNALLYRFPELRQIPRAGIVHRLDKDTSGLMVIARTLQAQNDLVKQLQARTVSRKYQALVYGDCVSGEVDAPIGRHPTHRTKMAVVENGKEARTHFESLERFDGFSHVQLALETGRTHQIRVHMAYLGHPLLGDPVYGKRFNKAELKRDDKLTTLDEFPRQALHAKQLGLVHPEQGKPCLWKAPAPEDFEDLLMYLRENF